MSGWWGGSLVAQLPFLISCGDTTANSGITAVTPLPIQLGATLYWLPQSPTQKERKGDFLWQKKRQA